MHVTVNRVELEPDTFAGLVSLRLPTDDELVAAGLPEARRVTGSDHRPRPRGGPRRAGDDDSHPHRDDDVETVHPQRTSSTRISRATAVARRAGRVRLRTAAAPPRPARPGRPPPARGDAPPPPSRGMHRRRSRTAAPRPSRPRQRWPSRDHPDGSAAETALAAMSKAGNSFECATTVATRKSPSRRTWTRAPRGRDARDAASTRGAFVAAGGQSGGLAGGVDTAHLHRHRGDTRPDTAPAPRPAWRSPSAASTVLAPALPARPWC